MSGLRSTSDISQHQRLKDNNEGLVTPKDMLAELCAENRHLTRSLRSTSGQRWAQRCSDCQLDRNLDWPDRAPNLVLSETVRGL